MTVTVSRPHTYREGTSPVPPQPPVMGTGDVARILTEEARAAAARRIVARWLQPAAATAADLLPDEPLRDPPTKVDQAVADLKSDLDRWARTPITTDMSEQKVEDLVADLTTTMHRAHRRLGTSTTNPHVQAARRTIASLETLIRERFDARKQPTVSRATVRDNVQDSYPATPNPSARFVDNPMPAPKASADWLATVGHPRGRRQGAFLLWYTDQEQAIRDWYRSLPGRGAGGGRPRKTNPTSNKSASDK